MTNLVTRGLGLSGSNVNLVGGGGAGGPSRFTSPLRIRKKDESLRHELEVLLGLVQETTPQELETKQTEVKKRLQTDRGRVQRARSILDPGKFEQLRLLLERIEAIIDRKVEQAKDEEILILMSDL